MMRETVLASLGGPFENFFQSNSHDGIKTSFEYEFLKQQFFTQKIEEKEIREARCGQVK